VTVVRSDSGLVADVSSLGPAKHTFLAAGFAPQQVFSGHGILLGYSAENSGASDSSLSAEGTATGPAAGATISQLVLPAGTYVIGWTVGYGAGAVAAAEQNNMQLTGLAANLPAIIPAVASQQVPQQQVTLTTTGVTIAVKAIAAGTATAVYEAQLTATPVVAGFLRLYDGRAAATAQVTTSQLGELATETQSFADNGIELKQGLWAAATAASIAAAVFYIVLQDE
jgi:hypothetical protein